MYSPEQMSKNCTKAASVSTVHFQFEDLKKKLKLKQCLAEMEKFCTVSVNANR